MKRLSRRARRTLAIAITSVLTPAILITALIASAYQRSTLTAPTLIP